jgi:hypothetical protein
MISRYVQIWIIVPNPQTPLLELPYTDPRCETSDMIFSALNAQIQQFVVGKM